MDSLNRISAIGLIVATALAYAPSAFPWGRVGHRASARMAEERLTPAARSAVREILGPGVSLADISTWADEQREVPRSAPWHYVNVPITESRYDSKYCSPAGCVVSRINDFVSVLKNSTKRFELQQALKFLVHFIADLHQPLHVGDNGSRGTSIQVRFYSQGSDLHRVWDSLIIERHTRDERVWIWDFNGVTNPQLAAEWSKGTPEDWATESFRAAKQAYCLPGKKTVMRSGTKLGDEYYRMARPLVRTQLAKAGVRIASVLNQIFR